MANNKKKSTKVPPYFILGLLDSNSLAAGGNLEGTGAQGDAISHSALQKNPSIVQLLGNYDSDIPGQSALAAYGRMLMKKYSGGGNIGFDESTGTNWNEYLNARDEDLLNDFSNDPSNPYSVQQPQGETGSRDKGLGSLMNMGKGLMGGGENGEGGEGGKGMSAGMISAIGNVGTAAAMQGVDMVTADDEDDRITGNMVDKRRFKGFLEGSNKGMTMGAQIGGPWGALIGAAAGGIRGGVTAHLGAKKDQTAQADVLKERYYGAYGMDLESLYADDDKMYYPDGGPLKDPRVNPSPEDLKRAREAMIDEYRRQAGKIDKGQTDGATVEYSERDYQAAKKYFTALPEDNPETGFISSPERDAYLKQEFEAQKLRLIKPNFRDYQDSWYEVDKMPLTEISKISYAQGGEIDEIGGYKHPQGGTQIKPGVEAEEGEVLWDKYVYSDQLGRDGKTFADLAKAEKKKFEERRGDGPTERTLAASMKKIMAENEEARIQQEIRDEETKKALMADTMAYGGCLRKSSGGRIDISPEYKSTMARVAKARGFKVDDYVNKMAETIKNYGGSIQLANGGPTDPPGTYKGRVIKGSEYHKQLQAQEAEFNKYSAQEDKFRSVYGDTAGTDIDPDKFFSSGKFDRSGFPEGATGIREYDISDTPASDVDLGYSYFDEDTGKNYYPVMGDPGAVDPYETVTAEDQIASYYEGELSTGNTKTASVGTIYRDDSGEEFGFEVNPEFDATGKTYDAKTRANLQQRGLVQEYKSPTMLSRAEYQKQKETEEYTPSVKDWGGGIDDGTPYATSGPRVDYDIDDITRMKKSDIKTIPNLPSFRQDLISMGSDANLSIDDLIDDYMEDAGIDSDMLGNVNKMPTAYDREQSELGKVPAPNFGRVTAADPSTGLTTGDKVKKGTGNIMKNIKENFGNEEAALLLSMLPAVGNLGAEAETTNLKRVEGEEVSFDKARLAADREGAKARAVLRESVRGNAKSSGQAISALASGTASISDKLMAQHLQSLQQEELTNVDMRNRLEAANTQIENTETEMNEANRMAALNAKQTGLADIGTNTAAYLKDKKLTKENVRQNKRLMSMINAFAPNYNWEDDNGDFAIQFIASLEQGEVLKQNTDG